MNISKVATKYMIIILVQIIMSTTSIVFYSQLASLAMNYGINSFYINNIIYYAINLLITVLLLIDQKKYGVKFKLLPLIGIFNSLISVAVFMVLLIIKNYGLDIKNPRSV